MYSCRTNPEFVCFQQVYSLSSALILGSSHHILLCCGLMNLVVTVFYGKSPIVKGLDACQVDAVVWSQPWHFYMALPINLQQVISRRWHHPITVSHSLSISFFFHIYVELYTGVFFLVALLKIAFRALCLKQLHVDWHCA